MIYYFSYVPKQTYLEKWAILLNCISCPSSKQTVALTFHVGIQTKITLNIAYRIINTKLLIKYFIIIVVNLSFQYSKRSYFVIFSWPTSYIMYVKNRSMMIIMIIIIDKLKACIRVFQNMYV